MEYAHRLVEIHAQERSSDTEMNKITSAIQELDMFSFLTERPCFFVLVYQQWLVLLNFQTQQKIAN